MHAGLRGVGHVALADAEVTVVSEWSPDVERQLTGSFGILGRDVVSPIALDTEGVDLSRAGTQCIVQIATPERCFIIDVLGKRPDDPLIQWLRGVLEHLGVVKIIHDSKMDSDALKHHFDITLANTHDTQCWHTIMTGQDRLNLNDTLEHYRLPVNESRDKNIYQDYPTFWATRPITAQMIRYAAGDIHSLFDLYQRQQECCPQAFVPEAKRRSQDNLDFARSAQLATLQVRNLGRFIGRGGLNMRSLEARTNTKIYSKGRDSQAVVLVYYYTARDLEQVRIAAFQNDQDDGMQNFGGRGRGRGRGRGYR